MSGLLEQACAVHLACNQQDQFKAGNQLCNTAQFLQIKRINNMLSYELGLLIATQRNVAVRRTPASSDSGLSSTEAHKLAIKVLSDRLLIGLPRHTVVNIIKATYAAVQKQELHKALGRTQIDEFPDSLTMIAYADSSAIEEAEAFIVVNVISKLLQEDDSPQPLILCFTELLTRLLIIEEHSTDQLIEIAQLPETSYENNVLAFSEAELPADT